MYTVGFRTCQGRECRRVGRARAGSGGRQRRSGQARVVWDGRRKASSREEAGARSSRRRERICFRTPQSCSRIAEPSLARSGRGRRDLANNPEVAGVLLSRCVRQWRALVGGGSDAGSGSGLAQAGWWPSASHLPITPVPQLLLSVLCSRCGHIDQPT
ncbi:hypothetical protein L226DRAFT_73156 [Lentinus tigrinus ALCF2SS1-7]|uniref:uncharacterized protein n=1 Tax=Lentinus tigrinus ALCF2SS1-7 TaxID=1328758 RepID=UPI00116607B6|nr:hypothetical protein L226DRAFT_73156 [Lentinus tigrinus ALCF2SS1-7]